MILNTNNKSGFLWIPKNAGHSVSKILLENGYKHYYEPGTTPHIHSQPLKNYYKHLEGYFLFCFVRNPWDRILSLYSYLTQKESHRLHEIIVNYKEEDWKNGFNYWLLNCENSFVIDNGYKTLSMQKRPQIDYFTNNDGSCLVDYIGKLETIQEDFYYIASKLQLPTSIDTLNTSHHLPYRHEYSKDAIEFVYEYHKEDILQFNYQF